MVEISIGYLTVALLALLVLLLPASIAFLLWDIRRRLAGIHGSAQAHLAQVVAQLATANEKIAVLEVTALAANVSAMAAELNRVRRDIDKLADAMSPYISGADLKGNSAHAER